MNQIITRFILAAVLVYGVTYAWNHHQAAGKPTAQEHSEGTQPVDTDPTKKSFVTVSGPLADLFQRKATQDGQRPTPYDPSAEVHIEESPVGTSTRILHRTFPVGRLVHVAFQIPPHAVTPRFHGTFSSYGQPDSADKRGVPSHDQDANVDLLLMNDQQYAAFAAGHDPEVLLIADSSHYQDIHLDLPPTRDVSAKYHMVFRNSPGGTARKLVQADFTVDF